MTEVRADAVVRPAWQRLRFWVIVALIAIVGGVLFAVFAPSPGRPLDPSSARKNGSKAVAVLLKQYGTAVSRTTSLSDARGVVLVASPDDYSAGQLRTLVARASRLILIAPSPELVNDVIPSIDATDVVDAGRVSPGCSWPGALAAGRVDLPDGAITYEGDGIACYDGALLITPRVVVIGSEGLLRNDNLARDGVAALDVNALSDNRTLHQVVWLLPGSDANPSSGTSVWTLFPSGARRVALWLAMVGVLLILWRGRRLGPPVTEPLPVVVRAAEIVEGHGRLYRRAAARDRAAAALRAAAAERLAARYGLPKQSSRADIAAAVATHTGRDAATVSRLLSDDVPVDDAELMQLAAQLDDVTATRPAEERGRPS